MTTTLTHIAIDEPTTTTAGRLYFEGNIVAGLDTEHVLGPDVDDSRAFKVRSATYDDLAEWTVVEVREAEDQEVFGALAERSIQRMLYPSFFRKPVRR